LSDPLGISLLSYYYVLDKNDPSERTVKLTLTEGSSFKEAWKYSLVVNNTICSKEGSCLSKEVTLSFVVGSASPFEDSESRSKIVIVSDIHMSTQKASEEGYSIFTQNNALFYHFLEEVRKSDSIKELVILGDLLDNWIVPMGVHTLSEEIPDNKAYFQAIAQAEVNQGIFETLNQIADEGKIRLLYVPGNHDMLVNETIFKSLIPNGIWKGTHEGTGVYFPEEKIACEHGHVYDAFNAPDRLTTQGSILPAGYFISRIYATTLMPSHLSFACALVINETQDVFYQSVWNMAVKALGIPESEWDIEQIVTGVDGYSKTYSISEARDIYAESIRENWVLRQAENGVAYPDENLHLIESGLFASQSLEKVAQRQYFKTERANMVVFGHTHKAKIKKETSSTGATIYANSGAWCESTLHNISPLERTCIVLNTASSTGSKISMVSLYQYSKEQKMEMIEEEYIEECLL